MHKLRQQQATDLIGGTFLVDAHVHCHRCFPPPAFFESARENFAAAARQLGVSTPAAGWLLMTESSQDHVFTALRGGEIDLPDWTLEPTAEASSLFVRHRDGTLVIVVAGRQIVARDGLEVLALGTTKEFADGAELPATLAAVRAAGALPVLPWGFGKWWGQRRAEVMRVLETMGGAPLFLGDNAGRPAMAPVPRPFGHAARHGVFVLPGSDPLPLPAEVHKVASYGFVLEGRVARARPAAGLQGLLRDLEQSPRTFGRLERPWPFLRNQLAMQWRKRVAPTEPATLPHDVETPDLETASEGYARRFEGPIGAWFLDVQRAAVMRMLAEHRGQRLLILEVGGGHAQLTPFLLEAGHEVVVHGSATRCAKRLQPLLARYPGRLCFVASNLWRLPFPDRTFDVVIGVRLLAHIERAEALLGEMARVSRGQVIVDFPPLLSANLLVPLLFRFKRRVEGDTRPFFLYRQEQIMRPLRAAGFEHAQTEKQFCLPMGVHRAAGAHTFLKRLEAAASASGFTALVGGPVLLSSERRGRAEADA